MGNFSSLQIGMTALRAFKSYQDIIGSNIANVSNKNYKRRDGILEPIRASDTVYKGVDLVKIKRTVDYFAERDVRSSISNYERKNFLSQICSQLETYINVIDESSISNALSSFWQSLDDLSKNPSDVTLKNSCVSKAKQLAVSINLTKDKNLELESKIFDTALNDIKFVNQKLREVSDLNDKIMQAETSGFEANSLRDARDGVIEELSEYCDFDMIEDKNGYRLSINGISVVNGSRVFEIKGEISGGAVKKISYFLSDYNQDVSFGSGKLSAYSQAVDDIEQVNSKLDMLVSSFVSDNDPSINKIHKTGYDSTGNISNRDLFVINSKGLLDINSDIISNPSLLASSSTPYSMDGSNALKIADILKSPVIEGKSYFEFMADISSELGFKSESYKYDTDTALDIKNQALNRRDSVSGVSVDEEMVKLMEMQKAYATMSKYMISTNQMLDDLINIIR